MAAPGRPRLGMFTSGLSSLSQSASDPSSPNVSSPAEQRAGAKANMFQSMRLPTQHVWVCYFDKQVKDQKKPEDGEYNATLEQLDTEIKSVADFWRYENNVPVEQIKMRESIYLFKEGYKPIWEDRRNILGGSWTFRVPKSSGREFWKWIQLMAISETFEGVLDTGDQICGVGLSVRFNSHLISIWHRDASKQKSIDGLLEVVLTSLPEELKPKGPDNYFYKKHADHVGFKAPPELQAVLDSQKRAQEIAAAKASAPAPTETKAETEASKE
ncbi:putative Eukaryotic translation initiation factor 4E type 3 [Seiridium unicorne]|uniref:Eukaryotic translation initiation factor 4E type 3 n=1 Tax=Seiridium unicorne TaxID=138068 RepID=A0ABR2VJ75_9PEZI